MTFPPPHKNVKGRKNGLRLSKVRLGLSRLGEVTKGKDRMDTLLSLPLGHSLI